MKVGGSANPAMAAVMRKWTAAGAVAAGRQAQSVGVVMGAVTVVDEDGRLARERARREVAPYLDVVGGLDPTVELPAGLLEDIGSALRGSGAEAAAPLIPDENPRPLRFAGTPEAVAEHAIDLLRAGADRVDFGTPHGVTDDRGLELLGARVLPAIREAMGGSMAAIALRAIALVAIALVGSGCPLSSPAFGCAGTATASRARPRPAAGPQPNSAP